jgi:phosphoribosyl 1,2-cyclic phosphate phosphodiesterase
MPDSEIELLLLGTGTSAGVPMIGCHCAVCDSTHPHDKRSRPSAVISYGDTRVLIDTTPELRLQCVANGVDRIDAVVYTHAHADHIMGLDDLRRFNSVRGGPLDVWADAQTHESLSLCFAYAFRDPDPDRRLFRPQLTRRFIEGDFQIAGTTWMPVPLIHGEQPILGFRVGHVAYCTDVSLMPDESYELLMDLDVLVLDALHWKRHPTHFSIEQALEVVGRVRPKLTLFTHIGHALGHEATNARLPAGVRLGYDGERARGRR